MPARELVTLSPLFLLSRISDPGERPNLARLTVVLIGLVCLTLTTGCQSEPTTDGSYPKKPVKVIVPFGAGGGSDTFTRILQKAIADYELSDQPLVVINMPGAGGSIGASPRTAVRAFATTPGSASA